MVERVADANAVQVATLVAASVSAVGSCIAGLAGYQKMQRETQSPRLTLHWNDEVALVTLHNRAASSRTAYSIGLVFAPDPLQRTRVYAEISGAAGLCVTGQDLPVELKPGERLQWQLPHSLLKQQYMRTAYLRRPWFSIAAELGEARYVVRPRRALRKLISTASPMVIRPAREVLELHGDP